MSTLWNKTELEKHLAKTKSMTETAKLYNVSRERIRQVAMREIGRERLIELGIPMRGAFTKCSNCGQKMGLRRDDKRCQQCARFYEAYGMERSSETVHQIRSAAARRRNRQRPWSHCSKGHPLAGDNAYIDPDGRQYCRTCQRARSAKAMQDPSFAARQKLHQRAYRVRNREKLRARVRERYATDPEYRERRRMHSRKSRAKRRAAKKAEQA